MQSKFLADAIITRGRPEQPVALIGNPVAPTGLQRNFPAHSEQAAKIGPSLKSLMDNPRILVSRRTARARLF